MQLDFLQKKPKKLFSANFKFISLVWINWQWVSTKIQILLLSFRKFSSVLSLSCVRLCDPMDCSTSGFPVHHQLPKLAQTHVHWVSDAIQPSHPLTSPSPSAFSLSPHQGLLQWVSSSQQVVTGLEKVSFHSNPKERQCQRKLKQPQNCTHLIR